MPTAEAAPEASRGQRAAKKLSEELELDAEPELLELEPELEQGTIAGLLRHEQGWAVPRSADKCRSKLQAARLRLLLCFLQHERLAERCPSKLREWGLLETVGGCFAALDPSSDAFWEEAERAAGLRSGSERIRALQIRAAFTEPEDPTELDLDSKRIGDEGAAVLGAALGAMDAPLPFETINLRGNEPTAAGMRSIAEGMGRGRLPNLREVSVENNSSNLMKTGHNRALGLVGDDGLMALAEVLADCASLERLYFGSCGVRGAGFEAVAALVPRWPKLRMLYATGNPGPSDALARALIEYIMHHETTLPGKRDCSILARQQLFTEPPQRSCWVLWGHLLAKDGSECHPKSYTAPVISGAASDFTTKCGLFFWIEGLVKVLKSP